MTDINQGTLDMLRVEERYEAKVDRSGDCHLWVAGRNPDGYGWFWGGKYYPGTRHPTPVLAHRWGYEHYVGPIPEGMLVCHTCDNPPCQRQDHWFLGTKADNNADRAAKGRTRCNPVSGEQHYMTKLTEDDVREIRRRASQGEYQRVIADSYGIHQGVVSRIVNRKAWGHVDV